MTLLPMYMFTCCYKARHNSANRKNRYDVTPTAVAASPASGAVVTEITNTNVNVTKQC